MLIFPFLTKNITLPLFILYCITLLPINGGALIMHEV